MLDFFLFFAFLKKIYSVFCFFGLVWCFNGWVTFAIQIVTRDALFAFFLLVIFFVLLSFVFVPKIYQNKEKKIVKRLILEFLFLFSKLVGIGIGKKGLKRRFCEKSTFYYFATN